MLENLLRRDGKKEGVPLWPRVHLFPKGGLFNFSGQLKENSAVQTGRKCLCKRERDVG